MPGTDGDLSKKSTSSLFKPRSHGILETLMRPSTPHHTGLCWVPLTGHHGAPGAAWVQPVQGIKLCIHQCREGLVLKPHSHPRLHSTQTCLTEAPGCACSICVCVCVHVHLCVSVRRSSMQGKSFICCTMSPTHLPPPKLGCP